MANVGGGDTKSLGDGFVELLHVGKVADLARWRAVGQLAVEHHVKLLGGRRASRGRGQRTVVLLGPGTGKRNTVLARRLEKGHGRWQVGKKMGRTRKKS